MPSNNHSILYFSSRRFVQVPVWDLVHHLLVLFPASVQFFNMEIAKDTSHYTNNQRAVARVIAMAGSQMKLAKLLGINQRAISWWLQRQKQIPAIKVPLIEKALQHQISRHEMRPDVFDENGLVYCDLYD